MTFPELGLPPELVAALARQHITEPTPIQVAALPVLMAGKDAYLNAETGTGKTLAYLLPIFCHLDAAAQATQVVIVAPTHELAIQIQRQCTDLAQNAGWPIRALLLIGGTSLDRQIDKLKKKPHLVVGSPGRILELMNMRKLKLDGVRSVVIDEADRLLLHESLPAIRGIIQAAPRGRQLIFASATEQQESAEAIATLAPELVMLQAGAASVNENIEHLYIVCEARDKPDVLRKLLHALNPERAMVFVHRSEMAENVTAKLDHHKIPVADLHASSDKRDRKQAMDDFRSAEVRVLVASDVAARGLDIKGVSHIFNLDVPTLSKAYLHRVGRTARAGAKGQAVTLMTDDEVRLVRRYESELGIVMHHVRLREGQVIDADADGARVPEPERARPARIDQPVRPATKRL
ncbi:MAG: DEAD/DEAH box helicase [Candidatus Eisenbacteria bacterium]|uniref:DEAD/DEAH box helicase n=1 Tax=Eiseniibacteriota bacterium TaxID=2212470 RepID=A0A849SQV7_UNCEI|nr:DEAD/DEAH box helicase [Candidatus Eisenbacteria bacterium]